MRTRTQSLRLPTSNTPVAPFARRQPIQIVVTPRSGDGRALDTAQALHEGLRARRSASSLNVFADLVSLQRWAATARGATPLLICVGGDSTQSTTATVAVRRSVPFLPVSCGFGNLFAKAIGAPRNPTEALERLDHGQVVDADVGTRNGELFLCQQSYGLIADVQEDVEAGGGAPRARWRRWLAYYRAAVRHLRRAAISPRRVVVDGRVVALDAALVIVANVEAYGAALPLTPDASLVDGLLDVFVMRAATPRAVFWNLLRRHLRIPGRARGATVCRGRRVRVSGPGAPPDRLEVVPGGLPIVVPPATAARFARERLGLESPNALDAVAAS
jgi:diacylglycerol kinase family enzyme